MGHNLSQDKAKLKHRKNSLSSSAIAILKLIRIAEGIMK